MLTGSGLVDIAERARSTGSTSTWLRDDLQILDLINAWPEPQAELSRLVDGAAAIPEKEVEFLPPVKPGKMLAIGRNYLDHAAEGGSPPPPAPLIFMKLPNSLTAHESPIVLPTISEQVDYEAELAVVIGKQAKRVNKPDALAHVFGYKLSTMSPHGTCSLAMASGFEVRDSRHIRAIGTVHNDSRRDCRRPEPRIEGRLNGQTMQSSIQAMIFKSGLPGFLHFTRHHARTGATSSPPELLRAWESSQATGTAQAW